MSRALVLLWTILLLSLAGCGEQDMADQPSLRTYERSEIWPNGMAARPLPDGAVARDDVTKVEVLTKPPPMTPKLMAQGRRDFDDICAPCHGYAGDGDGMVVQRGFSPPPSYHSQRLRSASAAHFVDVITNGYGAMYAYADRVPPEERWAIVAYIRALQLSRKARLSDVAEAGEALR